MAITYDEERDAYWCWNSWHKRWDVLEHFGVHMGRADEISAMLQRVCKSYYDIDPAKNQNAADTIRIFVNKYLTDKTLPLSVVSTYCRQKGLIPKELERVA